MANKFGSDILIQAEDPEKAAAFYVNHLGFESTATTPMIGLHGNHINLFIERGPALGPVLEVTIENAREASARLLTQGCEIIKHEPHVPRTYVRDPYALIYNLTT
jgi:hypothetical protein